MELPINAKDLTDEQVLALLQKWYGGAPQPDDESLVLTAAYRYKAVYDAKKEAIELAGEIFNCNKEPEDEANMEIFAQKVNLPGILEEFRKHLVDEDTAYKELISDMND